MEPTSYFSTASSTLDPTLFHGDTLRPEVRATLLGALTVGLATYRNPERWSHAWIAGSGASYQWAAARDPADLDVLVGIDFDRFREDNPGFRGFGDGEIAAAMNADFRATIIPMLQGWNGYETTFYVNMDGTDIRNLHPYAAYDITKGDWTVHPDPNPQTPHNPRWEMKVEADNRMARDIVARYSRAISAVNGATNAAHRINAEVALRAALDQGTDLFNEIHGGRSLSFSRLGEGYGGFGNFRWQAGKARGTVQALREIADYANALRQGEAEQTYGVDLPDTQTLVRRALSMSLDRRF